MDTSSAHSQKSSSPSEDSGAGTLSKALPSHCSASSSMSPDKSLPLDSEVQLAGGGGAEDAGQVSGGARRGSLLSKPYSPGRKCLRIGVA